MKSPLILALLCASAIYAALSSVVFERTKAFQDYLDNATLVESCEINPEVVKQYLDDGIDLKSFEVNSGTLITRLSKFLFYHPSTECIEVALSNSVVPTIDDLAAVLKCNSNRHRIPIDNLVRINLEKIPRTEGLIRTGEHQIVNMLLKNYSSGGEAKAQALTLILDNTDAKVGESEVDDAVHQASEYNELEPLTVLLDRGCPITNSLVAFSLVSKVFSHPRLDGAKLIPTNSHRWFEPLVYIAEEHPAQALEYLKACLKLGANPNGGAYSIYNRPYPFLYQKVKLDEAKKEICTLLILYGAEVRPSIFMDDYPEFAIDHLSGMKPSVQFLGKFVEELTADNISLQKFRPDGNSLMYALRPFLQTTEDCYLIDFAVEHGVRPTENDLKDLKTPLNIKLCLNCLLKHGPIAVGKDSTIIQDIIKSEMSPEDRKDLLDKVLVATDVTITTQDVTVACMNSGEHPVFLLGLIDHGCPITNTLVAYNMWRVQVGMSELIHPRLVGAKLTPNTENDWFFPATILLHRRFDIAIEYMKACLELGADPNISGFPDTPLDIVESCHLGRREEVAELLVSYGAKNGS